MNRSGNIARIGRRLMLLLCASLGCANALMGVIAFATPVSSHWCWSDRCCVALHFFQGRVRLFIFESSEGTLEVIHDDYRPALRVRCYAKPDELNHVPPNANGRPERLFDGIIRIGDTRQVKDFGFRWRGQFQSRAATASPVMFGLLRLPVWLPSGVLLLAPVVAIYRMIRVRGWRKEGRCEGCGYLLEALVVPRCPECGLMFGEPEMNQRG